MVKILLFSSLKFCIASLCSDIIAMQYSILCRDIITMQPFTLCRDIIAMQSSTACNDNMTMQSSTLCSEIITMQSSIMCLQISVGVTIASNDILQEANTTLLSVGLKGTSSIHCKKYTSISGLSNRNSSLSPKEGQGPAPK